MKAINILILFFSLFALPVFSQTGQEQEFDYGIKNNAAQTVTTPDFVVTQTTQGVYGKSPISSIIPAGVVTQSATFTAGRIPYTTGVSSLADSNRLLWNNTSSIFEVNGNNPIFRIKNNLNNYSQYWNINANGDLFLKNHEDKQILQIGTPTGVNQPTFAIGNFSGSTPPESQLYVYGGSVGANIDARGSETVDEANIDLESSDWNSDPKGLGFSYFGPLRTGLTPIYGYAKTNLGQIRFGNTSTAIISSINTSTITPIRFGINTAEIANINDKGMSYQSDFSSVNSSNPRWLVDKSYVDTNDLNAIHKTGNENFAGQKGFTNSDSSLSALNGIQNRTTGDLMTLQTGSAVSGGVLLNINSTSGNAATNVSKLLVLNSGAASVGMPLSVQTAGVDKLTINKNGDIVGNSISAVTGAFTGAVTGITPTASNHFVTKSYADGLVVGLLDDRGSYNASSNTFPTTGGSGTSGAILKGDLWYVSVAGTLGGKSVNIGDSFRALVDSPAQVAGNWALLSSNLSYVPANDANVLHTTGNETKSGILSFNNTTSTTSNALNLQNSGANSGSYALSVSNSNIGNGITGSNSGNGSASAVLLTNTGTGRALSINNNSSGNGIYLNNSATGRGFTLVNDGSAEGVIISGSSSGNNIVSNQTSTGTGLNFVGQNANVNTFSVSKTGDGYFAGNVGIGTVSPTVPFDISKNINSTAFLLRNNTNSFYAGNDVDGAFIGGYKADNSNVAPIQLQKFGGNVGIGITNPIGKLDISLSSDIVMRMIENSGVGELTTVNGGNTDYKDLSLSGKNLILKSNNGTEKMRISSNGNVGVGTDSPLFKVHMLTGNNDGLKVESANSGFIEIAKTGGSRWRWQNDFSVANSLELIYGNNITPNTSIISALNNGNVGIGITSPSTKLDVNGNSTFRGSMSLLAQDQAFAIGTPTATNFAQMYYSSTGKSLNFTNSGGANTLVIKDDTRNVLIKTTTDDGVNALQVNGTISTTGLSAPYQSKTADEAFNETPYNSSRTISTDGVTIPSTASGYGFLETFKYGNDTYGMQRFTFFTGSDSSKVFVRAKNTGGWTAWVEK